MVRNRSSRVSRWTSFPAPVLSLYEQEPAQRPQEQNHDDPAGPWAKGTRAALRPSHYIARECDVSDRQDEREEDDAPGNELIHDDPCPRRGHHRGRVNHAKFTIP